MLVGWYGIDYSRPAEPNVYIDRLEYPNLAPDYLTDPDDPAVDDNHLREIASDEELASWAKAEFEWWGCQGGMRKTTANTANARSKVSALPLGPLGAIREKGAARQVRAPDRPTTLLGIDPGTATMGWGVIRQEGSRLRYVQHGAITTPSDWEMPRRLRPPL